jgi:hypothetical protein
MDRSLVCRNRKKVWTGTPGPGTHSIWKRTFRENIQKNKYYFSET